MNPGQVIRLKWSLRKYLRRHHIPEVPKMNPAVPVWGKAAQLNSIRCCGSRDRKVLAAKLAELTPAGKVRAGIVAGYKSIVGAKEGGTLQRAIAKFWHISAREPWCAETAGYVLKELAGYLGPMPSNGAFVPSYEELARRKNIIVAPRYALPGMLVSFVWSGPKGVGRGQHIGALIKSGILRHTIAFSPITAEGNAGGPGGDAVRIETRYWYQINLVMDYAQLQPAK